MNDKPAIGIIEWLSDSGVEPAVFLADDMASLRRAVAAYLIPLVEHGSVEYIGADWIAENPAPDLDDPAAVEAWETALQAATTDAWLTVYTHSIDGPGSDTYQDLRNRPPNTQTSGLLAAFRLAAQRMQDGYAEANRLMEEANRTGSPNNESDVRDAAAEHAREAVAVASKLLG